MPISAPGKNKFSKNRFRLFEHRIDYELYIMITFDRIKILTNKKYVEQLNSNVFTVVIQNNLQKEIRYSQRSPYQLYINNREVEDKCVIEFSAKAMLDRYPELINKNNIHSCFDNINDLGLCKLHVQEIVNDSEFLSCDVTRDIVGIMMPDKLAIKSCIRNLNKFRVQKYGNSGHTVTKEVKTKSRQIRLSFYDKYKELNKACNRDFLDELDDKNGLLAYFNGKFRVEANIKTISQIRQLFQVDNNQLMDVMNSQANPLLTWFDEALELPDNCTPVLTETKSLLSYNKLSELKNALLLQACDYDIEILDLILNNCLSPNTNKSRYRNKFVNLINEYHKPNQNIQVISSIREKLLETNCKSGTKKESETEH
jgi:hypothetical protein